MLSVNGIYENGQVTLLDEIPHRRKSKVIITILEEELNEEEVPTGLFDDIVGSVSIRNDGSINHDQYISKEN